MKKLLAIVACLYAVAGFGAQKFGLSDPAWLKRTVHRPLALPSLATGQTWTYVQSTNKGGSFVVSMPAAVTAGNLLIVFCGDEGSGNVTNVAMSTGGNMTSNNVVNHSNGDAHVGVFYTLSGAAGGTTFTGSGSGTMNFRGITAIEASATGTHALDTSQQGTNISTSIASGAFTTATLKGFTVASFKKYSGATFSAQAVGGNSATRLSGSDENELITWYYINAAQLISATSTATLSSSTSWTMGTISFNSQ